MKRLGAWRAAAVSLACLGMIVPETIAHAATPARGAVPARCAPPTRPPAAGDVELDARGGLHGVLVNVQGIPLAGTEISLRSAEREIARTVTDDQGRFTVDGLRGGTYQLIAGRYVTPLRAWAVGTAPPKAARAVLVVVGEDVARGQRPLGQFLTSECVLCAVLIGAAIAIPIAVYNSHRRPASP